MELGRPAIYDAWEARYSYQMEDRKMVPIYKGREVGRTWGRDSQGRLDEAKYLGTSLENDEDLFALHQKKLDKQRNRQWENAKEARAERVREMFADIEAEEDDSLIEIVLEDEEEEFIPAPSFIPVGIDMGKRFCLAVLLQDLTVLHRLLWVCHSRLYHNEWMKKVFYHQFFLGFPL